VKLVLLWVGRTRDRNLRAAIDGYLERVGRYLPVTLIEVKEEPASDRHSREAALQKEGRRIRGKIPGGHEVVLLDVAGRELSSQQLATFLGKRLGSSSKGLVFVIGGHEGVDDRTRESADQMIALSRMTLTHEMARLVLAEQLYRALSILHGGRYHR